MLLTNHFCPHDERSGNLLRRKLRPISSNQRTLCQHNVLIAIDVDERLQPAIRDEPHDRDCDDYHVRNNS
jgi:hypothetical protein